MSYTTWRGRVVIAQWWRESLSRVQSVRMMDVCSCKCQPLAAWITWKWQWLGCSWWWCKGTVWLLQCSLWREHRAVFYWWCWRPRFCSWFLLDRNRSATEACRGGTGRVRRRVISTRRPTGGIWAIAIAGILSFFSFTPLGSAILKPHLSRQRAMIV